MKKLQPKGNIIMLALFVLFASALLGILVSLLMKNFFKYSHEIYDYNKADYLAKAGEELWFSIIHGRLAGVDFNFISSQNINSHETNTTSPQETPNTDQNSDFLNKNFSCPEAVNQEGHCTLPMQLQLTIQGTSNLPAQLTLPPGRATIIPLFSLATPPSLGEAFWSLEIKKKSGIWFQRKEKLQSEILSWEHENEQLNYQIIANLDAQDPQEVKFDENQEQYSQEATTITSHARFKATELSRESKITNKLPDFLLSDNYLTVVNKELPLD